MIMNFIRDLGMSSIKAGIANNAPSIFKGFINEFFTQNNITPETVIPMVENKQSLWKMVKPEAYTQIEKALEQIGGNLDWFTMGWLLEATREKHPALVSLFVTWKKGQNWLNRQIEEVKTGIEYIRNNGAGDDAG